MSAPVLLSSSQAEPAIANVFRADGKCALSVSEERAFKKQWLSLGDITLMATKTGPWDTALNLKLVQQGAFEWHLPGVNESAREISKLLDLTSKNGRPVHGAMNEVASIATRVGLVHPRFDPTAIEQMPFRRSTTIVADTSGVLQGALDFVARFLHPAARVKIPAITQMEIANFADRFLSIRRARKDTPATRTKELKEHLISQGGQRALLRLELHADTEVERTYLLGDPLRSAFKRDADNDLKDLNISSPIRSYADRLILESARHHQAQSGPAHVVRLLTGDQGLARMALAEGVQPLYFTATNAAVVFGQQLAGQTFDPFSGYIRHTSLTALLWELAVGFGTARLTADNGCTFQVSALGEHLSWAPYHAEQDLLWCVGCAQQTPTPSQPSTTASRLADQTTLERPPLSGTPARPSITFDRFVVERMFQLVCALDDRQEMNTAQVEEITRARSSEYRRFLQSADLAHVADSVWKVTDRVRYFSAALRNERVESVREILLKAPSFAAFAKHLEKLNVGDALDAAILGRGLRAYRILGEIALLCATSDGDIHSTPNVPGIEAFSKIAVNRFSLLDQEGHGLVHTGAWLESLIRNDGIHPEVARRLLDEASKAGMLRRTTEGSTTQLRFSNRIVHVLRTEAGLPVVKPIHLYRGDYLIPGKASASLRIEESTS